MAQTREKQGSLVLSRTNFYGMKTLWYSVFSFLFFYLEPTVRKDIWVRTTSVTVKVIFQKCYSESYLVTAMFKVRFQQLRATLKTAI